MTMNGAVLPVLASFIVAGEEQGYQQQLFRHNPERYLKRIHGAQYLYLSPEPSMRIVDIIAHTAQYMPPKFNSISISGYHMQEAAPIWSRSWLFTLADGLNM